MIQPLVARHKQSPPLAQAAGGPRARPRADTARFIMRAATHAQHEATEVAFAPYDIAQRSHYAAFLSAHAAALPALELTVTGRGWSGFEPRFALLADDLAALSQPLPAPMFGPDASDPGVWGIQYVLEGSRLGGRLLCERIAPGAPSRYLSPTAGASQGWQAFCAALDASAREAGADWLDEATTSAIETFRQFQRAARAMVGTIA